MRRRGTHTRHPGPRDRGITVIELLVALAVVGFMIVVGYMGVRKVRSSDLRELTVQVAAVLRNANNMAIASGQHHRVVFDLDEQSFRIEACEGEVRMRRGERIEVIAGADGEAPRLPTPELARDFNIPEEMLQAESPEQAARIAEALTGKTLGGMRCEQPLLPNGDADGRANERRVDADRGIRIRRIFVQHTDEVAIDGTITVNFFPLGYAEKAIIEIADDDGDQFSLLVHGLTGRVEFRSGQLRDPNDHMLRDGAGERTERR
jgi:type II secretory pathway pseudopilin PulG